LVYIDRDQLRSVMLAKGIGDFNVLAAACGITRVSLSRYVNKVYPLSAATEAKLREALGAGSGRVKWLTSNPAR
jgi:hypothetical protein